MAAFRDQRPWLGCCVQGNALIDISGRRFQDRYRETLVLYRMRPIIEDAGRFQKLCGARPIQPFDGSRWRRRLCKLNGVGVMRKASGRGSAIKKRAGRIGVVGICAGLAREFEGNLKAGTWFRGKEGTRRRQVIRGTGQGRWEWSYHAATPAREGGERSWICVAVSLSMTTIRPPHLGQSQRGLGSWVGDAPASICDGCAAAPSS
jgi:hypothetical protein